MPNLLGEPWSTNPNAPNVPKRVHHSEKAFLGSMLVIAVFHGTQASFRFIRAHANVRSTILGIIIVMFFQCLNALLDPTRLKERGVKWPLVAHTTAMFSFVTVSIVANSYVQIIAFIDNRNFPGADLLSPGPTGYFLLIVSEAIVVMASAPMVLNGWLADGLLVCFAMNIVTWISHIDRRASYIVASLFTPKATGSSPSRA